MHGCHLFLFPLLHFVICKNEYISISKVRPLTALMVLKSGGVEFVIDQLWAAAGDTHLGGVQSSTVACGNAASEQAHSIQRSLLVHLGQRDVGHHGVLREGAGPHEVKHLLPLASEA